MVLRGNEVGDQLSSTVVNSRQRSSIVTNGRQQIDSPRQQRRLSKIDSQLPANEEDGGGSIRILQSIVGAELPSPPPPTINKTRH